MYEEVSVGDNDLSPHSDSDPLDTVEIIPMVTPEVKNIKMYKIASKNKFKMQKYKKLALGIDLSYTKVIIPANMRSRYWKFFGFPADDNGDIISKDHIVCSLCNVPMHFHKNTTNLRSHLQRHHRDITFSDDEDYIPSSKKEKKTSNKKSIISTPSTSGLKQQSILQHKKIKIEHATDTLSRLGTYKKSPSKQSMQATNALSEAESELLETTVTITNDAIDYQQYDQNNVEQQQQDYDIIDSSNDVGRNIIKSSASTLTDGRGGGIAAPTIEVNLTELIQQMILTDLFPTSITEGAGFMNLIWTICGNVQIPPKKEIETSIDKLYEEKSSKLIRTLQDHSTLNPFSLGIEIWHNNEKKTLITIYFNYIPNDAPTTFNNVLFTTVELSKYTNFEEVFQGINLRNCSAAIINSYNNIVANFLSLYDIPSVNCFDAVIQRCMKLVFNIPELSVMFTEIYDLFYKHSDVLPDPASLPRVDDGYQWTKYNLLRYFFDNVTFQDEENDLLLKTKTILECLQPFKLTLETLIDEPNAVCSLIKPLAFKLVEQHFQPKNGDYELAGRIKDIIGKELRQSLLSNNFLVVSSFLDPRFHSFINENEMDIIYQSMNSKAEKLQEKLSSSSYMATNSGNNIINLKNEAVDTPKRSSLKLFFDNTQRTQINNYSKVTIEQEIMKYRTEVFTDLEQCPLDWWSKMAYTYPQMKIIADQYKCIPCCTSNNFKRTVEEQIDFNNRRLMLRGHTINQLLFLHYNKKFLD